MFKSPRTFLHAYAAITGLLIGLAIWWLSSQIRPPEAITGQESKSRTRQAAFVTQRHWYLEKIPTKDGTRWL